MTYSYSFDEERYYGGFQTVQEAIIEAIGSRDEGQSIFIGENTHYTAHDFVVGYHILEGAQQQADDEFGEFSADWLDSILRDNKKIAELEKLVGDWLQKQEPPSFFTVNNIREVTPLEIFNAIESDKEAKDATIQPN